MSESFTVLERKDFTIPTWYKSLLAQYEEVYKDLTKNSKQLLITDFITTSQNVNISVSNIESAQITSSDESEFQPSIPKKRIRVISDSDEG